MAIIGRTQYLVILPVSAVFLLFFREKFMLSIGVFLVSASVLPGFLVLTWGGIVPPYAQDTQSGINIYYGILGFAYGGFFTFLLAPRWFVYRKNVLLLTLTLTLLAVLANVLWIGVENLALKGALKVFLNEGQIKVAAKLFPGVFIFAAFYFIFSSAINIWKDRLNPMMLFYAGCAFLIFLSCFKSTFHFSSRYPFLAAPFLILMIANYQHQGFFKIARMIAGIFIGVLSMVSYYASYD